MMRAAALFREACIASPQAINAFLSAEGFDDISRNGLLVLGAVALNDGPENGGLEGDLARDLGITEQTVGELIDALIRHGYMECQADQNDRGRAVPDITMRGHGLLSVATDGVRTARWADFPFRPGDIVISTLPKSGTTWLQMICALLIFQGQDLPAPLPELSPWMESDSYSRDEVYARLAAQEHRRFIKTHLPLNEIPIKAGVTYIVVARHPLDVAVSMYHQDGPFPLPPREWLIEWFEVEASPRAHRNSLPGAMRRMSYVWAHREPNVLLLHYQDLSADLEGEMLRLAAHLGITVPDVTWPGLVQAATFEQMRAAASRLVDSGSDPATFFRRGASGSGCELLTSADLDRYRARVAQLAPPDLLAWLHRDDGPNGAFDDSGGASPIAAPAPDSGGHCADSSG
jgi:DNA-binding MarR family transcriptional regulator